MPSNFLQNLKAMTYYFSWPKTSCQHLSFYDSLKLPSPVQLPNFKYEHTLQLASVSNLPQISLFNGQGSIACRGGKVEGIQQLVPAVLVINLKIHFNECFCRILRRQEILKQFVVYIISQQQLKCLQHFNSACFRFCHLTQILKSKTTEQKVPGFESAEASLGKLEMLAAWWDQNLVVRLLSALCPCPDMVSEVEYYFTLACAKQMKLAKQTHKWPWWKTQKYKLTQTQIQMQFWQTVCEVTLPTVTWTLLG